MLSISSINTKFMRASLFASAAIMIGVSLPAMAQDAPADDESANAEIIVTAQKREERLQDIPLAVSVIGGDAVANNGGITLENAQYLVPSLNFRKSGTSLNQALFLRGVGTINFSIAAEPSVAAVLDGVVLSRAGEGFTDLFDVERIEVLRGPQGTLFGKNASAGVVSIVTKRPTADFGATVEASYFTKSEYRGRATVNVPLAANVRSRFTGFYGNYDGNVNNLTKGSKVNGYEHYGVRGAIEADVSENIMLTLRGDYRKANDDCCAEIIGTTPTNAAALALANTGFIGADSRNIRQNLVTATKEESWGISLQADIALGEHSLTSITSYRGWDNTEIRDGDWLDQPYVGLNQLHDNGPQTSNTFSQELRIASPTGQFLEYVVGAYYSKAESDRTFTRNVITCSASTLAAVVPGLVPCSTASGASTITTPAGTADFGSTFKNVSVFGQTTLNLSDSLRLIGGLRYTHDTLDVNHIRRTTLSGPGVQGNFDAGVYNNGLVATLPATGFVAGTSNGVPFTTSTSNNNLSGKAGVQADLTENNMAYASYTRGYKGPAYNIFYNLTTVGAGVIAPETVNAYEVGLKNTFLDGDLIVNLAAYYAKYNNYQANSPDFVAGVRTTRLTNAGSVSTKGFELDFVATPSRNFTLSGGVAYNKARVEDFRLPPGADSTQLLAKGTPLANAPKWKMSLGAQYDIETSGFANIELGSQIAMQSDQIYELSPNPAVRLGSTVDGYAIVDLTAALVDPNDGWRVAFQVKNLFDKSFASSIVSGGPGGSFRYIIPREADRYFGVTAKINFAAK
ncbi:CirA Outer membrane receptor proteins, mostly Fe transport [Sphingomonadaceae bacterium]|jgi:iron complex outermembrane receptor protein